MPYVARTPLIIPLFKELARPRLRRGGSLGDSLYPLQDPSNLGLDVYENLESLETSHNDAGFERTSSQGAMSPFFPPLFSGASNTDGLSLASAFIHRGRKSQSTKYER